MIVKYVCSWHQNSTLKKIMGIKDLPSGVWFQYGKAGHQVKICQYAVQIGQPEQKEVNCWTLPRQGSQVLQTSYSTEMTNIYSRTIGQR